MDGEAQQINASTDEMLKSMGLKALGDILALRAFRNTTWKLSDRLPCYGKK